MKPRYLGDSYDIVKQSLLRWLGTLGTWKAYPMFTEDIKAADADAFYKLLGVQLLSTDVLHCGTNRQDYFKIANACQDHLFLDPDTGLRLKATGGRDHPSYIFGSEVITLVTERPNNLTMVFDQALPRGREREMLTKKIEFTAERGILSFAYVSHACFILMSLDRGLLSEAWEVVHTESCLPEARFIKRINN